MNKLIIIAVVIVLAAGAGFAFMSMSNTKPATTTPTGQELTPTPSAMENVTTTPDATQAATKEFTVTGSNFKFDMSEMKVKKGDTVKITFKNASGIHDFVIDEFDLATKQLSGGQEETVEFVADQAGTFEFYCSVGQHRQMGMKGNLIVEE